VTVTTLQRDANWLAVGPGGDETGADLPPLARALLDALDYGVLVLNVGGELLYANPPAQAALRSTTVGPAPRGAELKAAFVAAGARVVKLRSGATAVGEAVWLPHGTRTPLAEIERQAIFEMLRGTGEHLSETARRLGISRTTLWRRLRAYGWRPSTRRRANPGP
jgi:transcriptional regulator of acetoin/glycerol metabolism